MDDTLVFCSTNYKSRKDTFATTQHARTGIPKETCLEILTNIDVSSTRLGEGHRAFHKVRFPTSFRAASVAIDIIRGVDPDLDYADDMYSLGEGVFTDNYPLIDGVRSLLHACTIEKYNMFILSKGDDEIQRRKIAAAGLDQYFPENHIYINLIKTVKQVNEIIDDHDLVCAQTVFIGDSLQDDVKSGLEAGIWTGHFDHSHGNPVWNAPAEKIIPHFTVTSISKIMNWIQIIDQQGMMSHHRQLFINGGIPLTLL